MTNEQHSQDRTSRFALDTLLRDAGYVLIERKHNQQPLWKHRMSNDVITEEQALAKLPRNKVIMAKKRQREYWENFRMTKVPLASEGAALCSGLQ